MILFTKRETYEKQIAIYFHDGSYEKAYVLSREFAERFKEEVTAHFLLMKSAFWMNKFEEAIASGIVAFNLSHGNDMLTCGVLLSSAYYLKGDIEQCQTLLGKLKAEGNTDVQRLMIITALALQDEKEAEKQINQLYHINRRVAEEFVQKFL